MTKEDKYWFWLMRAISDPLDSYILHLYDISLSVADGKVEPIATEDKKSTSLINNEVNKFVSKTQDIIILEKLTLSERASFAANYMISLKDEILKNIIASQLNELSQEPLSLLKSIIYKYNKYLYLEYDIRLGAFLVQKIESSYGPLGITEESQII